MRKAFCINDLRLQKFRDKAGVLTRCDQLLCLFRILCLIVFPDRCEDENGIFKTPAQITQGLDIRVRHRRRINQRHIYNALCSEHGNHAHGGHGLSHVRDRALDLRKLQVAVFLQQRDRLFRVAAREVLLGGKEVIHVIIQRLFKNFDHVGLMIDHRSTTPFRMAERPSRTYADGSPERSKTVHETDSVHSAPSRRISTASASRLTGFAVPPT